MACCQVDIKLLSEQCWIVVSWTPRNNLQWNFSWNAYILIQENLFQNVVGKMAAISSQPQCIKSPIPTFSNYMEPAFPNQQVSLELSHSFCLSLLSLQHHAVHISSGSQCALLTQRRFVYMLTRVEYEIWDIHSHFSCKVECMNYKIQLWINWRTYVSVNLPSLVQIMACRLDGAKPLSEPMLEWC